MEKKVETGNLCGRKGRKVSVCVCGGGGGKGGVRDLCKRDVTLYIRFF